MLERARSSKRSRSPTSRVPLLASVRSIPRSLTNSEPETSSNARGSWRCEPWPASSICPTCISARTTRASSRGRGADPRGRNPTSSSSAATSPSAPNRAVPGSLRIPRAGSRTTGHEVLGVPGNHDVPLVRRAAPLPVAADPLPAIHRRRALPVPRTSRDSAVLGINTARSLTFKDGRISHEQMDLIRDDVRPDQSGHDAHPRHPSPVFALPVGDGPARWVRPIGRQEMALDADRRRGSRRAACGHNHRASTHSARDLVTRAGARWSSRQEPRPRPAPRRGAELQPHRSQPDAVTVVVEGWDGTAYVAATAQSYVRQGDRWRLAGAERELEQTAH